MKPHENLLVSFMGWSDSGKTTFIETCIRILSTSGYRVFALKSTHMTLDTDTPGTDSYRFKAAGAEGVCLLSGTGTTVFLPEKEPLRERIQALFPDADIILAEGYHGNCDLRFEVVGDHDAIDDLKCPIDSLAGVITDSDDLSALLKTREIPVFSRNDPEAWVQYILERNTAL